MIGLSLRAIVMGLDFHREFFGTDSREAFEPMWQFEGVGTYPPPLDQVPKSVTQSWLEFAGRLRHPILRARLNHLLWQVERTNRNKFASEAIDAYVLLSTRPNRDRTESAADLAFALDMGLRISDDARVEKVIERMTTLLEEELSVDASNAGAVIHMIGNLARLPHSRRPLRLADLAARAEAAFDDPFLLEPILELRQAITSEPLVKKNFADQMVDIWLRHAALQPTGLARAAFLDRALIRARRSNLSGREQEVLLELEKLDLRDSMTEISATVEVPRGQYEAWLNSFIGDGVWTSVLTRLGTHLPVASDRPRLEAEVRREMSQFPLQHSFQKTIVDRTGRPLHVASSDEERFRVAVAQHESLSLSLWGIHVSEVLEAVWPETLPSKLELISYFASELIADASARAFAQALEFWVDGQYEASLMVSIPRIEATIRRICEALGLPTYSIGRDGFLKANPLGTLLGNLRNKDSERLARYFESVLCDALGLNLRNLATHGLLDEITREQSALIIHLTLVLAQLRLEVPTV